MIVQLDRAKLIRWLVLGTVILAASATILTGKNLFAQMQLHSQLKQLKAQLAPIDGDQDQGEGSATQAKEGEPPAEDPIALAAERVAKRNLFSPPPPTGFQGQIIGALGHKAIFSNGQAGAAGDSVMGAKVLEVGPDWVRIEFEGNEQKLWLFKPR
jgi:hypothetical protein